LLFQLAGRVFWFGRSARVSVAEMLAFGRSSRDTHKISRLIKEAAPLLFDTRNHWYCHQDPTRSLPREFKFLRTVWEDLTTPGQKRYATYSAFANGKHVKPAPKSGSAALVNPEIWKPIPHGPGFLAGVQRLQNIEFFLDEKSASEDPHVRRHLGAFMFLEWQRGKRLFVTYRPSLSGRVLSCGVPLQGLPKALRKHLKPRQGFRWLYLDFKSQEPRILAHLSRDPILKGDVAGDGGIYGVWMKEFGISRPTAKVLVNKILNGGRGEDSLDWARIRRFWGRYTVAAKWVEEKAREIVKAGYVTCAGDVIREDLRSSGARRFSVLGPGARTRTNLTQARCAGVNHLIQGSAATIARKIIERLPNLVLPIHDGFLIEIPVCADEQAEVAKAKATLEGCVQEVLPDIDLPVAQAEWELSSPRADDLDLSDDEVLAGLDDLFADSDDDLFDPAFMSVLDEILATPATIQCGESQHAEQT
jgi:hypothetical protein